jgi:mannonate dehydratase
MNLGFGLYRHQLDDDHFGFARQCGATHLVVHYTDYFNHGDLFGNAANDQPTGGALGWGAAGDPERLWSVDELTQLRRRAQSHGLNLFALENFDPAHWYDILLDGPLRAKQIENIRTIVRNVGAARIGVMGYYFSVAGVYGRQKGPWARGGAESVGVRGAIDDSPIPTGMAWNMRYRTPLGPGTVAPFSYDELLRRWRAFLTDMLPVAEASGVRLALHPDDPPLPTLRGTPRLVHQPTMYDQILDAFPSRFNALEYCLGTLSEMTERGDGCAAVYDALNRHSRRGAIAYVHFRNVRGVVPDYHETFVDEGDLDMRRVVAILRRNGFDGVLIPDHAPVMSCPSGWHAGMAYAMGYMNALLSEPPAGGKA